MYKHDADVWHAPGSSDHPMATLIRDQTDMYLVCPTRSVHFPVKNSYTGPRLPFKVPPSDSGDDL